MDRMLQDSKIKQPKWIAHRGAHLSHPENSMLAFKEAIKLGFYCIETDLRATRDGIIILNHDPDLRRSFGIDALVEELNYKRIQSFYMRDGQKVVTLDELLAFLPQGRFIFDIKPETGNQTLEALSKSRVMDSLLGRVRCLYWDWKQEKNAKVEWPEVEILANERQCLTAGIKCISGWPGKVATANKTYSLTAKFSSLSLFRSSYVERYHAAGARLIAFLPDSHAQIEAAVAAGFDEILTNGLMTLP